MTWELPKATQNATSSEETESLFSGQYPVVFATWADMKSITSHNNNNNDDNDDDDGDDGSKHSSYCQALF